MAPASHVVWSGSVVACNKGVRKANSTAWPVRGIRLRWRAQLSATEPVVLLDQEDQRLQDSVLAAHLQRRFL